MRAEFIEAVDVDGGLRDGPEEPRGLSVRCRGVVHLYRTFEGHDVVALQGVDLDIAAGERVAFLGPSGSGKSTLLTLFGGIQPPSAGKIFLGDDEISRMSERALTRVRARRVSTMLQGAGRNLLPYATARQNLAFARVALGPHRGSVLEDGYSNEWDSPTPRIRPCGRCRAVNNSAWRLLAQSRRCPSSCSRTSRPAS